MRDRAIWAGLVLVMGVPIIAAAFSPQLAWRDGVYITAGLAGIIGMALILLQPLLAGAALPGLTLAKSRRIHRASGVLLLSCVILHVGALWVTSPPDVMDALTFRSPTPFAIWGVLAMWALFLSAALAALRARLPLRPIVWRRLHTVLALVIAGGTVAHALLIDGTMETLSKTVLSVAALGALGWVIWRKRLLHPKVRTR